MDRSWCFTLYNGGTNESVIEKLRGSRCAYAVVGAEQCMETGRAHIQGFVHFKSAKTLNAAARAIGEGAHVERRRGSFKEASDYCKKGTQSHDEWSKDQHTGANFGRNAVFLEHGILPMDNNEKGRCGREAYAGALQLAREGKVEEIGNEYPDIYIRHLQTLTSISYKAKKVLPLEQDCKAVFLFGPTGTGKTYWWESRHPFGTYYILTYSDALWWDGYTGEETVIIEEFDHKWEKHIGMLKTIINRFPMRVQIKGGIIMIRPKSIIITSNYSPECLFIGADSGPIRRRFEIIYLGTAYVKPKENLIKDLINIE